MRMLAIVLAIALAGSLLVGCTPEEEGMAGGVAGPYQPDPERAARYDALYRKYLELGDCLEDQLRALG